MPAPATVVTIPNVNLTLEQLLFAIRQLDEPARVQVARILAETHMEAKLAALIKQLTQNPPANDISDAD